MILYNVTCSVDKEVYEEWYEWMRNAHIPDVMKTGMFLESRICRVKGEEQGGVTFAVQYLAASQEKYDEYNQNYAPALQRDHSEKYGQRVAAFRTILEVMYQARQTDYSQAQNQN